MPVDPSTLEKLGTAITERGDEATAAPVRRSFSRMRTEDPDPEVDPLDPPTQPVRRPQSSGDR